MPHDDLKKNLEHLQVPEPSAEGKQRAMQMAMQAFEEEKKKNRQGNAQTTRPIHEESIITTWIRTFDMKKSYAFAGSFAAVAVVLAVTTTHYTDILNEVNPKKSPVFINIHEPAEKPEQTPLTDPAKEQETDKAALKANVPLPKPEVQKADAAYANEAALPNDDAVSKDVDASRINKNAPGMSGSATSVAAPVPASAPVRRDVAKMKKEKKAYNGTRYRSQGIMAEEQVASPRMAAPGMMAQDAVHGFGYVMPTPKPIPPVHYGGGDRFEHKQVNSTKLVNAEPVSTFSIDVDTASYAFVRRVLNQGTLPQPQMVRVEELINYFSYNYATPAESSHPFKPSITVVPSPWNSAKKLVHIGIKGFEKTGVRPPANLVFLLDVSGSMSSHDKLPLVKSSLHMLVDQMKEDDTISIVTYAGRAGTALQPTRGSDKQTIRSVIDQLGSGGSTAGAAGIEQAYNLAQKHFDEDSINRVILATDGDFNVGMSNNQQLKKYIEKKRESGISLSVLGYGQGNYNDALMQSLAQHGNGNAAYIDSLNEARKVLVDEMNSTLFTIAKDVKIQVEWNPAAVSEYRLVGYETRLLNREDFNNDKVDAGEVGAGHTVTAIYEITPKGAKGTVDPLRYGKKPAAEDAVVSNEFSGEYGFLKIRYKEPKGSESTLMTQAIDGAKEVDSIDKASADTRFATAVAGFGQLLKRDPAVAGNNFDEVIRLADSARGKDPHGIRAEFVNLARTAKSLSGGGVVSHPDIDHHAPSMRR